MPTTQRSGIGTALTSAQVEAQRAVDERAAAAHAAELDANARAAEAGVVESAGVIDSKIRRHLFDRDGCDELIFGPDFSAAVSGKMVTDWCKKVLAKFGG